MLRSVLLTSDFPPRQGGISNYLGQLYTRMRLPEHLVIAPRHAGDVEWDRQGRLPVMRAKITFADTWANDGLLNRPADRLLKPAARAQVYRVLCDMAYARRMLASVEALLA